MSRRLAAFTLAAALSPANLCAEAAPHSLCVGAETTLFACPVGTKLVSMCGNPNDNGAVYRFGRPGQTPELTARGLSLARQSFSGGGETQVSFSTNGVLYLIFEKSVRTGFGEGGRFDDAFTSGLIVRKNGQVIARDACGGAGDQTFSQDVSRYIKPGRYVPH